MNEDDDVPAYDPALGVNLPGERIVQAAVLDAPGGGKYLAVFDKEGKVSTVEQAHLLWLELRAYCDFPVVVAYQPRGAQPREWCYAGDRACAAALRAVPADRIQLAAVLLKRPNPPADA